MPLWANMAPYAGGLGVAEPREKPATQTLERWTTGRMIGRDEANA